MPNPLHYQQTQGQLDASPRRCLITEPRHFNHDATLISPSLQEITLQPITLQDCLPQCPCKMMAREMILEQFLGFSTSPNQRLGLLSIRSRAFNQIIVCKFPSFGILAVLSIEVNDCSSQVLHVECGVRSCLFYSVGEDWTLLQKSVCNAGDLQAN